MARPASDAAGSNATSVVMRFKGARGSDHFIDHTYSHCIIEWRDVHPEDDATLFPGDCSKRASDPSLIGLGTGKACLSARIDSPMH